jgi:hypothetical protein
MPKASIVLWLRSRQTYLAVASLHATPPSPFLFLLCVAAFSHVLSKEKMALTWQLGRCGAGANDHYQQR